MRTEKKAVHVIESKGTSYTQYVFVFGALLEKWQEFSGETDNHVSFLINDEDNQITCEGAYDLAIEINDHFQSMFLSRNKELAKKLVDFMELVDEDQEALVSIDEYYEAKEQLKKYENIVNSFEDNWSEYEKIMEKYR